MASSSVSTYLDITRAGKGSVPSTKGALGAGAMAESAKVVAAIHEGASAVPEISSRTELSLDEVMGSLGWLAKNGLVSVEETEGSVLTVHLTDSARSALASS